MAQYANSQISKVYIYLGSSTGLKDEFAQVIDMSKDTGLDSFNPLTMLGMFDSNKDSVNGNIF